MKWFLNSCRRNRENLCLLASGLLSKEDRAGIENHLAKCADCRSYYDEVKMVITPLATWEKHFAQIEPDPAVHLRCTRTIASVDQPEAARSLTPKIVLLECWRELIWPGRRIWVGLAAVWLLILAANFSMRDHSQPAMAEASPMPEVIMTWQQQERLLAELMEPEERRAVVPPKHFLPQPRSERHLDIFIT